MRVVSIDFETANEKRFSPCAVGIVVLEDGKIIDEFYHLINPLMHFNSMNIHVHGINEADVVGEPTFPEIWPSIKSYLRSGLVIAHNASFDMSVIRQTLDYFGLPYPEMNYLCTVGLSKQFWPGLTNYKLHTLANFLQMTFNHHHALEDARVAAALFHHAFRESEAKSLETFLDRCNLQTGRIYERGYVTPKKKKKNQPKRIYI
ncbi:3'-5' exonuclease [Virgibacillus salexigens]|uniref:Exonuclease domain-containing protein n=1 Tax=Virgibacillus kapii TaxID=1638645 RepID=A0ABQ2DSL3_9BACI|nr:3'-5' exonuclease [Virgibacillus kapii]GGJ70554.1 hypothetical protein GCM10007111_35130 [Virgibacillus kapii]